MVRGAANVLAAWMARKAPPAVLHLHQKSSTIVLASIVKQQFKVLIRTVDIEASCLQTHFVWDDLAMAELCIYKRVCVFQFADCHKGVSALCKLQLLFGQQSVPCKLAQ